MQIPVNQVVQTEPNSFNGLTKTTFLSTASQNEPVYMFTQPQNAPQVGATLDGTLARDQRGKLKFNKTPNPAYANGGTAGNFQTAGAQSSPQLVNSSAQLLTPSSDPRQESIEKQAYFKAAIELAKAWKETASTKTLPEFAKEIVAVALNIKSQMNQPTLPEPIMQAKSGDYIPTESDVANGDIMTQLGDIFGPGTSQVLPEGPNGL